MLDEPVVNVMKSNCAFLEQEELNNESLKLYRQKGISYVPLVSVDKVVAGIINLNEYRELIPVEAVIMAGGKGERLLPLTKHVPKPLLKIGDKPIIEHNIDRLIKYGIKKIHISINYLDHQIQDHFKNGAEKGICIQYIQEQQPLGTLGAVSLVDRFDEDVVLLMNSDLLTNIDLADFYNDFQRSGADMAVATVPHHVEMPYAIVELDENRVISFKEKPRYTYFANAGIYLLRKQLLSYIPKECCTMLLI